MSAIDLREVPSRIALFGWTALIAVPMALLVLELDWGLYHAADRSAFFLVPPLIATYVPVAIGLLRGDREPWTRRYGLPLTMLLGVVVLSYGAFIAEDFLRGWIHLRGTENAAMIGANAPALAASLLRGLPLFAVLGLVYVTIPHVLARAFPKLRAGRMGVYVLVAVSLAVAMAVTRAFFAAISTL